MKCPAPLGIVRSVIVGLLLWGAPASAAELPWHVVERAYPDAGAVTATATVTNAEGYVFSVYGKSDSVVRFRLERPTADGPPLNPEQPLSLSVDGSDPLVVRRDAVVEQLVRREMLHMEPGAIEWDLGQYLPHTLVAIFVYRLRVGARLQVSLSLDGGGSVETVFPLAGTKAALANVAGAFTPEYDAANRNALEQIELERRSWLSQQAAGRRCAALPGDSRPQCARQMRDCVLAHPDDRPSRAVTRALDACFEAIAR
jgi:hypothetical protein